MNNISSQTKLTVGYIVIAFAFSVAMRMIWVYHFSGFEPYMFNGQFMINTNDGYYWAEGARDILSGVSQKNDYSSITTATSNLTAFFVYILPFSFESIIFYMPAVLSSLVVVPIVLIAKSIDNLELGFIAALLASVAWSYYNRTMVGYYDTDMLNIVLPMFLLWSIIWAIQTNEDKYLLITALDILVYRWWYPQSYALEFSFFGLILLYTLIWDRKNLYNYKLLAIMMFAMLNIDGFIRFPIVIGLYYAFKQEKFQKYIYTVFAIAVVAFFVTGGFDPIWYRLKIYVFKDTLMVTKDGLSLHFYSVMQTIREAGQIPFETFANRISGHTITLILSIVGYIYLVYKHRIMILGLPMIGLGFLALAGGLRFTIYAVPLMAFGIAFLITELSLEMPTKKLKYLSIIAFTLAILYPNYKHIDSYKVPTVFDVDEVKVLDKLKTIAGREDYVISWWDYGYPIRYYGDVKTLVDGGKHSGSVNFPVSYVLTNPPHEAAKMARLDVEYTEKAFEIRDRNIDLEESKRVILKTNIEEMTKSYGFKDTNDFLDSLSTDIKLPSKTRDIYLYLPFRMLSIYPTVKVFSNLNLMNGEQKREPFFFMSRNFKETQNTIELGNGISLNKAQGIINIGGEKVGVKRIVTTYYDKNAQLQKNIRMINYNSPVTLIYMSAYKTFLVVDEQTYNSLYIQLMVLEEYDRNLFEQVLTNLHVKVYKLKI
ncbi:STT3 domain-containing protein [Sulfurimonas sp.]|uniref:STT3 domain-containing protein n=1 Tax=Sulfurimonas sp. TaxID=2022749 RepID=UPI002AB2B193|nr:STT3 domain-containing protein [Sulfurimonas sp.]